MLHLDEFKGRIARGGSKLQARGGTCWSGVKLDFYILRLSRTYPIDARVCGASLKKAAALWRQIGRGRVHRCLRSRWRVNCATQSHITAHFRWQARHALAVSL